MMISYYEGKKKAGLILTEAHLKRGGSNNSIIPGTERQYFRGNQTQASTWQTKQWSHEKHRYLTFEEWQKQQRYWERKAGQLLGPTNYDGRPLNDT